MPLRVSGKNLAIGEALREQITQRLQDSVSKFYSGLVTGHATVKREGSGFETDCVLHLSSGVTLHALGFAQEPYQSADRAAEKVENRLRRYKQRLKDHGPGGATRAVEAPTYVIETPNEDEAPDDHDAYNPVVIAETKKNIMTLSVSDAVLDLDMTGAPVVLFRHAGSGRINVVYRRTDGNIGWVDPPAADH